MRVLGFSKKWDKLQNDEHTTWRFKRKDRDWHVGEIVQEVYHPRGKDREVLQKAQIIKIENRSFVPKIIAQNPTEEEAKADGFSDVVEMILWFKNTYGDRLNKELMHKITLKRLPNE